MPINPINLPQADFERWLRESGKSIGGSTAGALMGVSPWGNPATVWDGIMGLVPDTPSSGRMDRGTMLEPIIADVYQMETGRPLEQWPTFRHPEFWYMRASPDRKIVASPYSSGRRGDGVLEIKCLGTNTYRETRTRGVAPYYYAQLQHYIGMTDKDWGAFATFNAEEWTLHHFDVERNQDFIDEMWELIHNFWNNHVLTRVRPTLLPDPEAPLYPSPIRLIPEGLGNDGTVQREDVEFVNAVETLRRAKEATKLAEHAEKQAVAMVKTLMGETERAECPTGRIVYAEVSSRFLDIETLAREHPEVDLELYKRIRVTRPMKFYARGTTERTVTE